MRVPQPLSCSPTGWQRIITLAYLSHARTFRDALADRIRYVLGEIRGSAGLRPVRCRHDGFLLLRSTLARGGAGDAVFQIRHGGLTLGFVEFCTS